MKTNQYVEPITIVQAWEMRTGLCDFWSNNSVGGGTESDPEFGD